MENLIKCPNCGFQFPVESALFSQAEEQIRKEYEKKYAQQAAIYYKKKEALEKEKEEFEKRKANENALFKERLDKRVNEAIEAEREKLRKSEQEKYDLKIKQLEEENEKHKAENKELREKELILLKKEAELKDREEQMKLDMEKKMLEKREEIAIEIQKRVEESYELKIKERDKMLEDQKKLIDEMKRKAEQGSMQMQGEVQELALAEFLRAEYPFDLIDDVPKGIQGADVIQTVVNQHQHICGKIIYESKRTKNFSDGWIEKLKNDQREQNAMIAVIVTEALPRDMDRFGRKDGIWICTYSDVKALTYVLREMIIREYTVLSSQENKGDKMESLYNYLVSDEFRQRVEGIVEGFSSLKNEMDREKRAMQKIWKEREKQIDKVIANTIGMYGSIRGIAGNVIAPVLALELTDNLDELDEDEDISVK